MIRVLILAASPVVRAGLEALASASSDVDIVARPFVPAALTADIDALNPDVAVVALEPGDDVLDLFSPIFHSRHAPALVILREGASSDWTADAIRAGARAVLPRDVSPEELAAAIAAAVAGLTVLPSETLAAALVGNQPGHGHDGRAGPLTGREVEVLQMLAGGVGNKTIAQRLGISTHTVKYHVASIMSKLHASSRTEAVTTGIRQGLILL